MIKIKEPELNLYYLTMYQQDKTFTRFIVLLASVFVTLFVTTSFGSSPILVSNAHVLLKVDDVINRVKTHNLNRLIGKESVRRVLEQTYQRRAALLPRFSLSVDQSRQKLTRGLFSDVINVPPFNSSGSRLEASFSFINYQLYADYRIAKLDHAVAEKDFLSLTDDYIEQALFLYFTHLRDLRSAEIVSHNLEREQLLLELAAKQFSAGVVVKIDVTRAEVRVASIRRALMEARITAESSAIELKSLLDFDLEKVVNLDLRAMEDMNPPQAIKRLANIDLVRKSRTEISSKLLLIEQAKLAKRASNWQRLPTVDFFANWGYDTDEVFNGEHGEAWFFGLRATVPLWEGGRIAADKRYASATLRQNEYEMRNLLNQIDREYKISIMQMDSRYAQIEIAQDELRLGRHEVELALERYQEGLADNRELIDAQKRLAEAERSHLNAHYMYCLSRLAFARSSGLVEKILD